MNSSNGPVTCLVVALAAVACSVTPSWSEVSAVPTPYGTHLLVIEPIPFGGVTDDPTPIGIVWIPRRPVAAAWLLNPTGAANGDDRPDTARNPLTGFPAAVWTHGLSPGSDIAFSEWNGNSWQPTTMIADGPEWDYGPRMFFSPDGTAYVVWWQSFPVQRALLTTRAPGATEWDVPVEVSLAPHGGRRPAVSKFQGKVCVAYERDAVQAGMAREVVVVVEQPDGSFAGQVVGATSLTNPLEVGLSVAQGRLWVDWRQDEDVFAHVEKQSPGWSTPATHAWQDYSWYGLELIRRQVRLEVLAP